jgi:DNA-binding CsgD family transcriptional regulator
MRAESPAQVRLTPVELDTTAQAAAGRSNKQVAVDMHLSIRTPEPAGQ